mgnify:CR=1 FL=1
MHLLHGERHWLESVVADLNDDALKLVYSDWLEEHGDLPRAAFLRGLVSASRSMQVADLSNPSDLPEEWVDLMGYWILRWIAEEGGEALALKEPALRLARPALRLVQTSDDAPVGSSRVGGLPDLPPGFPWPTGHDCPATFGSDITGERRLAGFLAQIQLAEIADTLAGRDLPSTGLLSFFCFQDVENDKPDNMGVAVHYFADSSALVRTEPPAPLTEGNEQMTEERLRLVQTLDLPSGTSPWGEELVPTPYFSCDMLEQIRVRNWKNFLGYARPTTGRDPTRSRDWRHLIHLETVAGCGLHLQLHRDDLAARRFHRVRLEWVDFD